MWRSRGRSPLPWSGSAALPRPAGAWALGISGLPRGVPGPRPMKQQLEAVRGPYSRFGLDLSRLLRRHAHRPSPRTREFPVDPIFRWVRCRPTVSISEESFVTQLVLLALGCRNEGSLSQRSCGLESASTGTAGDGLNTRFSDPVARHISCLPRAGLQVDGMEVNRRTLRLGDTAR